MPHRLGSKLLKQEINDVYIDYLLIFITIAEDSSNLFGMAGGFLGKWSVYLNKMDVKFKTVFFNIVKTILYQTIAVFHSEII